MVPAAEKQKNSMSRATLTISVLGVIVLFIGVAIGGYLTGNPAYSPTTIVKKAIDAVESLDTSSPKAGSIDLFGTMLAFQSSKAFAGHKEWETTAGESWKTFRDSSNYQKFLDALKGPFTEASDLVKQTGFSSNRDIVGAFTWNVIETDKGTYDWSIPDATLAASGSASAELSAVVQPYASWDSTYRINPASCVGIDFVYFDYAGALPVDEAAYAAWLTATVERYDGDGVDDMPGLTTRVASWELGNEIEGPCGGELADAASYVSLLKTSYSIIKAADPTALVLNAGALEIVGMNGLPIEKTITFWKTFFALGGAEYADIFNVHYNRERYGISDTLDVYEEHLVFFRNLLDANGHDATPMWLTEFGTYVGSPQPQQAPGQSSPAIGTGKTQTAAVQASWTTRAVVMGMSYGVERFFFDLSGGDDSAIGASALFDQRGEARDILSTLHTLANEFTWHRYVPAENNVFQFGPLKRKEPGQYITSLNVGNTLYVLWDGELPSSLSGKTVIVIDLDGQRSEMLADDVTWSEAMPVILMTKPVQDY